MPGNLNKPIRWPTLSGIIVATGLLVLGGFMLLSARADAWRQAEQDLNNLSLSLERDIDRNISIYDLSLKGARTALQIPGVETVSPEIRQAALFDQAASAEYLGSLLILDKSGWVVGDSTSLTPHPLSLADRDYFTVQQAHSDVGLYLSQPFHSRLRNNDPSIAISRRIDTADGQFNGIVVGTLRLAYFDSLFERLNLGKDGALAVLRTDGRLVARLPRRVDDFDRILGPRSQAGIFLRTGQNEVVATSEIDGVERFTVFRRIAGVPLVLAIGASTETIMGPWLHRSIVIAATLVILSATVCILCWLFSRELQSRVQAERKALQFAEQVSVLATTDAMTGLSNRGAFNERLALEWRRSSRNQTSLAVLMIDADHFKLFNDRYGHLEGDRILQALAACLLRRTRRPGDLCARFGGEEFVILLPETELAGARVIAEAIRAEILSIAMPHADSPVGVVSVSIGVAAVYPMLDEPSSDIVKRADTALYEAKRAGRNRVLAVSLEEARFDRTVPQSG